MKILCLVTCLVLAKSGCEIIHLADAGIEQVICLKKKLRKLNIANSYRARYAERKMRIAEGVWNRWK